MLNTETINHYLKQNGKPENKGYLLKDAGQGNFIARWDFEDLERPTKKDLEQALAAIEQERSVQEKKAKDRIKREAYQAEADPLFFKWQRGEATKKEWLDKVAEIKAKFK